ncbi:hypothetical protein OAU50_00925 [Planctomycetota bacterium]|nr:hypothetical protein [Planctomycetota bacterium]
MRQTILILSVLAVTFFVTASSYSQPEVSNWRTLKPVGSFIREHLDAASNTYEFKAKDLLDELSEKGGVSVDLNEHKLESLAPVKVIKGNFFPYTLFELTQMPLGARMMLVETDENRFVIASSLDIKRHAPLVMLKDINGKNPAEWMMTVVPVNNRRAMQPGLYQGYLTKGTGQITLTPGGKHVVILDRVSQVKRVAAILSEVAPDRNLPEIVPYQRRCPVDMKPSLPALQEFLEAWTYEADHDSTSIQIKWDEKTQALHGMIPMPLASFMDGFVDAALKTQTDNALLKELEESTFVQFEVIPEEGISAKKLESELLVLFRPEYTRNDARFLVKVEPSEKLVVRCRDWLQQDILDTLEVLQK